MVHADMSDQLLMTDDGDSYQNGKYSKVSTILQIICFY